MSDQAPPTVPTPGRPAHAPDTHPTVAHGRVGVLIVNLGTPDATDYWSMRRYLKEFLSDRRVVETPRWLWWPLLNGIILTTRPKRSGAAYDTIWNRDLDESPLRTITRSQTEKLAARLTGHAPELIVDWAMRYGQPAIPQKLQDLQERGCERILIVPLYPQYAAATTATVCDKAFGALAEMRWQPALRIAPPYHDDPTYIAALKQSVDRRLSAIDFEPDVILASFHGLPQDYLTKGDPYYCQCQKTARLLRQALGADENKLRVSFQSRVGRAEWLRPYTDETLRQLPAEGVRKLAVIAPGFAADCLETLEELAIAGREIFLGAGGERFDYIPCLNDDELGVDLLQTLILRELGGWI